MSVGTRDVQLLQGAWCRFEVRVWLAVHASAMYSGACLAEVVSKWHTAVAASSLGCIAATASSGAPILMELLVGGQAPSFL